MPKCVVADRGGLPKIQEIKGLTTKVPTFPGDMKSKAYGSEFQLKSSRLPKENPTAAATAMGLKDHRKAFRFLMGHSMVDMLSASEVAS